MLFRSLASVTIHTFATRLPMAKSTRSRKRTTRRRPAKKRARGKAGVAKARKIGKSKTPSSRPATPKPVALPRRHRRPARRNAATRPALAQTFGGNPFDGALPRLAANYQPLSPLSFLERAARVHPNVTAIVHGNMRRSYAEFYARSRRLASALAQHKIGKGDTVSVLLPNTPPMLEAHHGVPMTGAVLNAINTRLDAASIAFMLDHSEAKIFLVDREFASAAAAALSQAKTKPRVVVYDDKEFPQIGRAHV